MSFSTLFSTVLLVTGVVAFPSINKRDGTTVSVPTSVNISMSKSHTISSRDRARFFVFGINMGDSSPSNSIDVSVTDIGVSIDLPQVFQACLIFCAFSLSPR